MNRDDDTWSHQVELGWVRMTNLLPNTPYKVVISFLTCVALAKAGLVVGPLRLSVRPSVCPSASF